MVKKVKNNKISALEIVIYTFVALLFAFGITLAIFSVVGDYIGANNFITAAENKTIEIFKLSMDWRGYGFCFVGLAVVMLLITLFVNANRVEKVEARTSSTNERTKINLPPENTVVDLDTTVEK